MIWRGGCKGRAVGNCKWSRSDYERILDGRISEAKRFTFIVNADYLNAQDAVLSDWSGFKNDNQAWTRTREVVQDCIRKIVFDSSKAEREDKRSGVFERVGQSVNALPLLSKDRVTTIVNVLNMGLACTRPTRLRVQPPSNTRGSGFTFR